MGRLLHPFNLFGKPVWAASIATVLIFGSLVLFKTSSVEGDIMARDPSSGMVLRINGTVFAGGKTAIACRSNDTLEFLVKGGESPYFRILYQNDDGPLRTCQPVKSGISGTNFRSERLILEKGWKKKTIFCILSSKDLQFVEAAYLVNRYLRKELTRERPEIAVFYLYRKNGAKR